MSGGNKAISTSTGVEVELGKKNKMCFDTLKYFLPECKQNIATLYNSPIIFHVLLYIL